MRDKKLAQEEQERLNKRLILAIYNKDLSAVKAVIEAGALANCKDERGNSSLYYALYSSTDIFEYLLKAGANPNDFDGWTILHEATASKYFERVELLLKYKANMYIKDKEGQTPFDVSLLCGGYYDIAELFILHGYTPSEGDMQKIKDNRLIKAVKKNDLSAVKTAVEDGADVNAKDRYGSVPLSCSIGHDASITEYLLKSGANVNIQDNCGNTSLIISVKWHSDKVQLLLKYGADMYIKDQRNETPFSHAIRKNYYDLAELFILNGYIPSNDDFEPITETEREQIKTRFTTLTAQVQEHKHKLNEEAAAAEFAYADEVIEM